MGGIKESIKTEVVASELEESTDIVTTIKISTFDSPKGTVIEEVTSKMDDFNKTIKIEQQSKAGPEMEVNIKEVEKTSDEKGETNISEQGYNTEISKDPAESRTLETSSVTGQNEEVKEKVPKDMIEGSEIPKSQDVKIELKEEIHMIHQTEMKDTFDTLTAVSSFESARIDLLEEVTSKITTEEW